MKSTIVVSLLCVLVYCFFEAEIIKAANQSQAITASLTVTSEITLTAPSNITMAPALSMTQNTALNVASGAASAWTVKTNNYNGYTFTMNASVAPAMASSDGRGNSFADYTATNVTIPETWVVTTAYEFGFSVFGTDAPTATWGTDTDCTAASGNGVPSATLKWRGFAGATAITVATAALKTATAGTATNLCVAAEQAGVYAPSGAFSATITGTATTN